jgi:hypothetical protein
VTTANNPTTSASRHHVSRFIACHSSPVKNRKSVTNSMAGSARPNRCTLLRRSWRACRIALRSKVPRPYVVAREVAPKAAAKKMTNSGADDVAQWRRDVVVDGELEQGYRDRCGGVRGEDGGRGGG